MIIQDLFENHATQDVAEAIVGKPRYSAPHQSGRGFYSAAEYMVRTNHQLGSHAYTAVTQVDGDNDRYYFIYQKGNKEPVFYATDMGEFEVRTDKLGNRISNAIMTAHRKATDQDLEKYMSGDDESEWDQEQGVAEAGPFSYGSKAPRKGSVADLAAKKRKEQQKGKQPVEPKDQMVGVAKVITKGVAEASWTAAASMHAATRKRDPQSQDPKHNFRVGDDVVTKKGGKPGKVVFVDGEKIHVKDTNPYYPDHVTHHTARELKKGVVEGKDDLSQYSTERLKAYVKKVSGGGVPAFGSGAKLKRVQAELKRREQGVAEGSEEKDPVWNKGTPMPKDYTCHCGLYVHPSHRNPKAIHASDCPYAKKQNKEQGVAEGRPNVGRHTGDKTVRVVRRGGKPIGEIGIDAEASPGQGQYYVKLYDGSVDLSGYDTAQEALEELRSALGLNEDTPVATGMGGTAGQATAPAQSQAQSAALATAQQQQQKREMQDQIKDKQAEISQLQKAMVTV